MSVLLTHGYFLKEDPKEMKIMRPYPPLGLLYISSYLDKTGVEHQVFDSTFSSSEEQFKAIRSLKPKVLAVYVNLMTRKNVVALMRSINEDPELDIRIILGGPETRYHIEEFLDHGADILVIGEGEKTAHEVISAILSDRDDLSQIDGIAFRKNGKTTKTKEREKIKDLDEITFPARERIDMEPYLSTWKEHHGGSCLSVSTMRGCPYTCKWCSRAVYGLSYRRMSPKRVVDELEYLNNKYGADRYWFVDDVFTVSHKWMTAFVNELEKRNVKIQYECITRADRMNDEVIELLRRSGCFRVWIGAESGSQRIIDKMDRRVKVEQVRDMIIASKAKGLEAGTFIMLGYPGETQEDIEATIEHLKTSDPDQFTITLTYPIKGTELWSETEDIQTASLDWSQSSDRDIELERNFSTRFYDLAIRRVVNEVNYNKLKKQNEHLNLNGLKLRMKFEMIKAAMLLESRMM